LNRHPTPAWTSLTLLRVRCGWGGDDPTGYRVQPSLKRVSMREEYPKYYGLSRDTKIYLMSKWVLKLPRGSPVKVTKNTLGEIIVSIKIKTTIIIVLKRETINNRILEKTIKPIAVYVNGVLLGYANYKNPPFPLSLIP